MSVRRNLLGTLIAIVGCCVGCHRAVADEHAASSLLTARFILCSPDGHERRFPHMFVRDYVRANANGAANIARFVREQRGEGYAALACARAVFGMLEYRKPDQAVTEELFETAVLYWVQIGPPLPPGTRTTPEELTKEDGIHSIRTFVCPRIIVSVAGQPVELAKLDYASNWTIRVNNVSVDDVDIPVDTQQTEFPFAVVRVDVRAHIRPERLIGSHVRRVRVTITAPNGLSLSTSQTGQFRIMRSEDLIREGLGRAPTSTGDDASADPR